jgi:hypothetical protein
MARMVDLAVVNLAVAGGTRGLVSQHALALLCVEVVRRCRAKDDHARECPERNDESPPTFVKIVYVILIHLHDAVAPRWWPVA